MLLEYQVILLVIWPRCCNFMAVLPPLYEAVQELQVHHRVTLQNSRLTTEYLKVLRRVCNLSSVWKERAKNHVIKLMGPITLIILLAI